MKNVWHNGIQNGIQYIQYHVINLVTANLFGRFEKRWEKVLLINDNIHWMSILMTFCCVAWIQLPRWFACTFYVFYHDSRMACCGRSSHEARLDVMMKREKYWNSRHLLVTIDVRNWSELELEVGLIVLAVALTIIVLLWSSVLFVGVALTTGIGNRMCYLILAEE